MLHQASDIGSVLPQVASPPTQAPAPILTCPTCDGQVDVKSRHVVVLGSAVRVFCSESCKDGALAPQLALVSARPAMDSGVPAQRSRLRPIAAGGALLGLLFAADTRFPAEEKLMLPEVAPAAASAPAASPDPPPRRRFGPAWPPTEEEWRAELSMAAFLHPLPGPVRRMPVRDSRVFGAERPGERPPECQNGHCGVDIGGEIWGEPVLAVQDGIVDRVQRGPNPDRGGLYVRLSHRNGTVFTQYFHLAAIPPWLEPGDEVKMGEVIGLVGDTGVKNSGPHLHFTISVKPSKDLPEQFIDPEPLIALWPLKIPIAGEPDGMLVSSEAPGLVRGAVGKRKRNRRPPPNEHVADAAQDANMADAPSPTRAVTQSSAATAAPAHSR